MSNSETIVTTRGELATLIADALGGGVTLGGSWEGVSEIVARVMEGLPSSEPPSFEELLAVLRGESSYLPAQHSVCSLLDAYAVYRKPGP